MTGSKQRHAAENDRMEAARDPASPVLRIRDYCVSYGSGERAVRAVDGVSFDLKPRQITALVGESGSGKSTVAFSLMRLLDSKAARVDGGQAIFDERDLTTLSEREYRSIRGSRVSMIYQEPMTSLNPVLTIGDQICEPLRAHKKVSRREARRRAVEMLERVHIPDPGEVAKKYPHQLSGGMRQRAVIAMALVTEPDVLIADEPTTALDVTIQAEILNILRRLCAEMGTAILLITHDLGVVAETCAEAVVMKEGKVVEQGRTVDVFTNPRSSYTRQLLNSLPVLDTDREAFFARVATYRDEAQR